MSLYRVKLTPVYMKVGTLPGIVYMVRARDRANLKAGGKLQVFRDRYSQPEGVLIEGSRLIGDRVLWIAERF